MFCHSKRTRTYLFARISFSIFEYWAYREYDLQVFQLRAFFQLQMIRKEGYPAEAHVIPTEDGYLLTLHRIPGDKSSPPVFLQHGLLSSSADWVIPGKGKGLGMILQFLLKIKENK